MAPTAIEVALPWPYIIMQIVLGLMVALPGIITALRQKDVLAAQKDTHNLVNSRLSELLSVAKEHARAEGVIEGVAQAASKAADKASGVLEGKEQAENDAVLMEAAKVVSQSQP